MKILVIGDSIIDHYYYGLIKRQSPEDNTISVVDRVEEEYRLGGCLNVANNLKSLAKPKDDIYVSSVLSRFTANLLSQKKIIYDEVVLTSAKSKPHERELIKTRVLNSETHKQIVRLDNRARFANSDIQRYKNKCYFFNIKNFDAVVVSDYNKGIVDKGIIELLGHELVKCPIFIDTKNPEMDRWDFIKNKDVIFKVNQKEWNAIKHLEPENKFKFVITNGEHGASYLHQDSQYSFFAEPVQNADVVGAGDVFLSGLVIKYLETENIDKAITYANKAATKSVKKFGTCEVKRSEIE